MLRVPQLLASSSRPSRSSSTNITDVDLAVVGGGIVGAASALEIKKRFPALEVVILEKEAKLGIAAIYSKLVFCSVCTCMI